MAIHKSFESKAIAFVGGGILRPTLPAPANPHTLLFTDHQNQPHIQNLTHHET